jgi:hypothetical protein
LNPATGKYIDPNIGNMNRIHEQYFMIKQGCAASSIGEI